jgi:hypothetical protein
MKTKPAYLTIPAIACLIAMLTFMPGAGLAQTAMHEKGPC